MKQNNLFKTLQLLLLFLVGGASFSWAATVDIPTATGSFISWNDATLSNANVENNGANIGSTGANTVATFTLNNTTQQDYVLVIQTAADGLTGEIDITLTNSSSQSVWSKVADIMNTGSWYLNATATVHQYIIESLPAGTYTLTLATKSTTGSYAGNWGKLALFARSEYNFSPGTLSLNLGVYSNDGMLEGSAGNYNVGNITNGRASLYPFINSTEGVYKMTMDICRYNQGGTMNIQIEDETTREKEIDMDYTIASDAPNSYTSTDIFLPALITSGSKSMKLTFSNGNSYICNYKAPTFTKVYDGIAEVSAVEIEGQTVTTGASSDWYCSLPVSYAATTTFGITKQNGSIVEVTAVDENSASVTVTDNGNGTYSIPTPVLSKTTTVSITLTPSTGYYAPKTTYTFNIFRVGEMSLTRVTVDDTAIDVLDGINASPYSATYNGCYTTAPVVGAVQIDGANASVGAPSISGSTYTYTIHAAIENTDIERDYTLVLNNVHLYAPTGDEEAANIKNGEGTMENGTWTNGIYTLTTTSLDGGSNGQFKLNGKDYTITLPSDVVVKQFIIKDFANNYANNTGDHLVSVTSDGATTYIPTRNNCWHSSEGASYDLVVNIENHQAGLPIAFSFSQRTGQPLGWFQLTTVKSNPGTAPVKTAEEVSVVKNHAVVTLTFDREIPNDVTATINGGTVTAEGGSAVLVFPVWGLDYSTNYTMTIAIGGVTDNYGNSNTEAINVAVNTNAKPAVSKVAYDYVVSNATELDAALIELAASNRTADAARKTVFLKNGNYTYGTLEGSYQHNVSLKIDNWNNIYNVSLIGESKDGVVIEGTTDGITSSTLELGNGTGIYVQDMTIRNNYDFPKENRFKGVSVAVTGGNKAVLKNVAMQACQDTYVTGKRTYLENCDIYGTVDFICGGGDIFFQQCDLILVDRGDDVIVAPNTTADTKWGYVFQYCTVRAEDGATDVVDKSWDLGRPWQNEPRATYLNTTMEVLPTDIGWRSMSNIPTYFYEYNSMDSEGNALDLSVRGNSPTSTNTYTPVLTDEQAAKFTIENVLGGTDSWLPTEETAVVAAPANYRSSYDNGTYTLTWDAVADARCYVIFKDGEYLTNQIATSFETTEAGVYTVRAANEMGGLGEVSTPIKVVASPVATVTTTAVGWASVCFNNAVAIPDGTKAYYVSSVDKDGDNASMNLVQMTAVPANEGFIFNAPAGTYYLSAPAETPAAITNKLAGTLKSTSVETNSIYVLAKIDANTVGFKLFSGTSIAANKAYLPATEIPNGAKTLSFTFNDDMTTVVDPRPSTFDSHPSVIYNLSGQRVSESYKGIVIVNGKKYVRK